MFEKAREFREKYYTPPAPEKATPELRIATDILGRHAQGYIRKAAKIRSEIIVLESELSLVEAEIEKFMLLYHEKFSAFLLDDGIFPTPETPAEASFDEDNESVMLFEKRTEAFNKELKNTYRKLVKNFHPDMNHDEFDSKYFYRVQELYEKGDLAELVYIQSQIEDIPDENMIRKIEKLEAQIRVGEKKLFKLIERKADILSGAEYQLFMKFRLSEVRGYNFFEELLKRAKVLH